eukprot:353153-Chlamydomonas_euryale.AAC.2
MGRCSSTTAGWRSRRAPSDGSQQFHNSWLPPAPLARADVWLLRPPSAAAEAAVWAPVCAMALDAMEHGGRSSGHAWRAWRRLPVPRTRR